LLNSDRFEAEQGVVKKQSIFFFLNCLILIAFGKNPVATDIPGLAMAAQ
jgi:hypothetical protein